MNKNVKYIIKISSAVGEKDVNILAEYSDDAVIALYNALCNIEKDADAGNIVIDELISNAEELRRYIVEKTSMPEYSSEYFGEANSELIWPEIWQDMFMEYIPYDSNTRKCVSSIYNISLYKMTNDHIYIYTDDPWKEVPNLV